MADVLSAYPTPARSWELIQAAIASLDARAAALENRADKTFVKLREDWLQRPALNAILAPALSGNDAADVVEIVAIDLANKNFEVLGTNATTALVTFAERGLLLTTAGGSGDQMILTPHLDTNQTLWAGASGIWGSENSIRFEVQIKTGASIAATCFFAGWKLTNTSVVATDDDQCYFRYNATDGTTLTLVTSRGGVDITTDLGITVAINTLYRLRVEVASDRTVRAWVNNTEITLGTGAAALTDAINFIPYIGVHALTGAAKTLYVLPNFECSRLAA